MTTQPPRKTATKTSTRTAKAAAPATAKVTATKRRKAPDPVPSSVASLEVAVPAASPRPPRGKTAQIIALLERDDGASLIDLMAATGWQAHSVRGALSTLKKKLGQSLRITLNRDGLRQYRLEAK